jgi:hypothetical protein
MHIIPDQESRDLAFLFTIAKPCIIYTVERNGKQLDCNHCKEKRKKVRITCNEAKRLEKRHNIHIIPAQETLPSSTRCITYTRERNGKLTGLQPLQGEAKDGHDLL